MTQPGVPDPGSRPPKVPIPNVGTGAGNAILAGVNAVAGATNTGLADLNPLNPLSGVTDTLSGVTDTVNAARAWISDRHNWVRIVWFGAGVICFAVGAAMIARPAAQSAASTAATVLPAGKATRAVKAVTR